MGGVSLTVLGFLYKIVPFLVWYHCYSREVGRAKVPAMADLYSQPLQIAGYWLFLAGLLGAAVGAALAQPLLVRVSVVILLGGLAVFGLNLARMLRHFYQPQIIPFGAPAAARVSATS
jgi:hypothetical protein